MAAATSVPAATGTDGAPKPTSAATSTKAAAAQMRAIPSPAATANTANTTSSVRHPNTAATPGTTAAPTGVGPRRGGRHPRRRGGCHLMHPGQQTVEVHPGGPAGAAVRQVGAVLVQELAAGRQKLHQEVLQLPVVVVVGLLSRKRAVKLRL